jgi:hypothetical protein
MSITLQPALETKLRQNAEAEGLTIEAYLESLLRAAELAEEELEGLTLEGINSGEPSRSIRITGRRNTGSWIKN